jgi:hypothetical protein
MNIIVTGNRDYTVMAPLFFSNYDVTLPDETIKGVVVYEDGDCNGITLFAVLDKSVVFMTRRSIKEK